MAFDGYRKTVIGDSLAAALEGLMEEGKLAPEQAIAFMEEFDKVIVQHLESECKVKTKLTGVLGSYRHFDDVYYMFAKNVTAEFTFANKPDKETITVDRLKLLMCKNAKLNDALK